MDLNKFSKNPNSGIKLWAKAKEIIPGGNGLLSKRPERYAPDIWPTYFKSCKGVNVTDLITKLLLIWHRWA